MSINETNPPASRTKLVYTSGGHDPHTVKRQSGKADGAWIDISGDYAGSTTPTATTYTTNGKRALNTTANFAESLSGKKTDGTPCFPDFGSYGTKMADSGYSSYFPTAFKMNNGYNSGYQFSSAPKDFKASYTSGGLSTDTLKHTGNVGTNDSNDDPNTFVIHIGKKGGGDEELLFNSLDQRNIQRKNMHTYTPAELAAGKPQAEFEAFKANLPDPTKAKAVVLVTATSQVDDVYNGAATAKDNNVRLANIGADGKPESIARETDYHKLQNDLNGSASELVEVVLTCNGENLMDATK